ncbi:MAG: hypothetical protein ACLFSV_11720 [Alkalispirochaeta sp.]
MTASQSGNGPPDETRSDNSLRRAPWRDHGTSEPVYYTERPGFTGSPGAAESEECRPRRGGIFRGNRGLIITLIDIVFVTLLFIIFVLFLRPLSNRVVIDPYRVDLAAERIDEAVVVRATVAHRERSAGSSENGENAGDRNPQPVVTVVAGGHPSRDLAPRPGGRRAIELIVPGADPDETDAIVVTVSIDGTEREQRIEVR